MLALSPGPLKVGRSSPVRREKFAEPVDRVAENKAGGDVGEVGLGIDAVEFAGLDEGGEDCPVLATAVGAREQRILAVERERADRTLDDVGVDLDAPVIEEAGEPAPAREVIADRGRHGALPRHRGKLRFEPSLHGLDEWLAPLLLRGTTCVSRLAFDLGFDAIELRDARERLAGDRCGAAGGDLVELAPHMAPAEGAVNLTRLGERPITHIAVDLEDATEALEMRGGALGLAIRRIDVGDGRRVRSRPGAIIARIGP